MENKSRHSAALPIKNAIENVFEACDDRRFLLLKNWHAIMGPLGEKIRLERIADEDTLIIGVYDAHWMQELHMLSRTMIKMINERFDGPKIKKIQLKLVAKKVPFVPHSQHALLRCSVRQRKMGIVSHGPTGREQQALDIIKDAQLKSTLCLFLKNIKEGHYL